MCAPVRYQPNAPLPVTDATGCGDAYAAGFLFGWAGEKDVRPPLCAFPLQVPTGWSPAMSQTGLVFEPVYHEPDNLVGVY